MFESTIAGSLPAFLWRIIILLIMMDNMLKKKTTRLPTVIVPYMGPGVDRGFQDVFVYLRPETNGIKIESILMRALRSNTFYRESTSIVYLANIPGDFIVGNKLVEQHYSTKIHFIKKGKRCFSPYMRRMFENYFDVPFNEARIVGAFEALKILDIGWNELFNLRIPENDMLLINGQTIKKIGDLYVINYNIPALLHKNNRKTDIAVMIFRTSLDGNNFFKMIKVLGKALVEEGVLDISKPMSHAFHYSKGPFEQILDAVGYLYNPDGRHVPYRKICFYNYLFNHNVTNSEIMGIIRHPVMKFSTIMEIILEDDIYSFTTGDSYEEALSKFRSIVAQYLI